MMMQIQLCVKLCNASVEPGKAIAQYSIDNSKWEKHKWWWQV